MIRPMEVAAAKANKRTLGYHAGGPSNSTIGGRFIAT